MEECKLKKDVWGLILDRCTPQVLRALSLSCKKMNEWCKTESRWLRFVNGRQDFDFEKKVQRIEVVEGRVFALTELFQLIDVRENRLLLDDVRDFACDQKKVVVCRQVEEGFRFEQYVWPSFEKPQATSEIFNSVAKQLCVRSDQLAGCVNQTQVVLWLFELPGVIHLDKLELAVAGLAFDSKDQVVAREGFSQSHYRIWKGKQWSSGIMSHCDPTSELWCSYGEDIVVATDAELQLIESERKAIKSKSLQSPSKRCKFEPRQLQLLKVPRLDAIQGVKRLFGGRAFVTLDNCGQLIIWFSETTKEVLCKQDPVFRFVADQLTVGTDADGYPVIAYVMSDTAVRIFSRVGIGRK